MRKENLHCDNTPDYRGLENSFCDIETNFWDERYIRYLHTTITIQDLYFNLFPKSSMRSDCGVVVYLDQGQELMNLR